MTRRRRRSVLLVTAAALAAGLAGCGTTTSYSSRCADGLCTVTLAGAGAEADVNGDTLTVRLAGAAGGTATFAVDGEDATCEQGDELTVAGYAVTCTEVGDDRLTVEIR